MVYTQSYDDGSAANFQASNATIRGLFKSISFLFGPSYDVVYIHFTNGLFWPQPHTRGWRYPVSKFLEYLWSLLLFLRYYKKIVIVGHEITTDGIRKPSKVVQGLIFSWSKQIWVHTDEERRKVLSCFRWFLRKEQVEVLAHETFLKPKFTGSKIQARTWLKLPQDETILLCIGFIQEHKGFDSVVEAMRESLDKTKVLYIVGSLRLQKKHYLAYRDRLAALVSEVPQCRLVEKFLSDEEFDAWIAAADALVLPYKEIWSSGVGARAILHGTPIIFKDHPHLHSQFAHYSQKSAFSDKGSLTRCLAEAKPKTSRRLSSSLPTDYLPPHQVCAQVLSRKKILFIMPCFGEGVKGGAEGFVYSLAVELSKRGGQIEVWSSTSDRVVGRNQNLAGPRNEPTKPFTIRRFKANSGSEKLFDFVHRYMNQEGRCGRIARAIWKDTNLHGIGMEDELELRKHEFDVVHLFHYLLGSAHRLCQIAPEKTVLHPFVHNEPP